MQLTFILTCFAKYGFLVDFFVVTNQANYQDCSGIYNWSRHCISWSYTRTTRFLYLRTSFVDLSRGNFCQSMSLFNKPCCLWSFSSQGTVGFHWFIVHTCPYSVCYKAVFSVCAAWRQGRAEESYLSFVLNYKSKLYTEIFLNRLILERVYLKRIAIFLSDMTQRNSKTST